MMQPNVKVEKFFEATPFQKTSTTTSAQSELMWGSGCGLVG